MTLRFTNRQRGFTLIEIMVAVGVLGGLMVAIFASWQAIVKSSQIGITASVESHRNRIAIRSINDALTSAIMHELNLPYYAFLADTTGEFAAFSMVSHLPASFPGSGLFQGQPVRRVTFSVESTNSVYQLILRQNPILAPVEQGDEPYPVVLAKNVGEFNLEFFDLRSGEWMPEWGNTNQLPAMVRFRLGFARPGSKEVEEGRIIERIVQLPGQTVQAAWQRPVAPNGINTPNVNQNRPQTQ
ncbi:MAG: prepilin-type N-terminal cleavage/methylation domain-containing protein [Limisphaerales bacterium]